jgi:hypothetical protein
MANKLYQLGNNYYDSDKMLFCQDVGEVNADGSMGNIIFTSYGKNDLEVKENAIGLLMILNPVIVN